MPVNKIAYQQLITELSQQKVTLVAVSKKKPVEDIKELYDLGHRDFGENYAQELAEKAKQLPADIRWHFIGHLQSNKIKLIAPFVQLIQGVDRLKLLYDIDAEAKKNNRVIDCLLQVHIAREETKFGLTEEEVTQFIDTLPKYQQLKEHHFKNIRICGLMGMASFTDNMTIVMSEFRVLKRIFDRLTTHDSRLTTLSMGMSSDYKIAIQEGSNMVRIGSLLFGARV